MDLGILIAIVIVAIIVLAALAAAIVWATRNRGHRQGLRERFGPEYDRTVEQYGNTKAAERELMGRLRRARKLHIHPLSAGARERFAASWADVQTRFVDDPSGAVQNADTLVAEVMYARGYPVERFDERVADVSVDHPHVVQHYRAARALADSVKRGEASTEDLRQAMVHYRVLFEDLLAPTEERPAVWRQQEAGT
jgi:hypothetical protein